MLEGACHDKVTFPIPAVACKFWGGDGMVRAVALASFDTGDVPILLTAVTL